MSDRWKILAFLCGICFVYTIDRALLGLLAIPIQTEIGLSDVRFGVLNSAVFWAFAALVPFSGIVGDRCDRRKVIGIATVLWSVMTLCAAFAGGFWTLLALVSVAITVPQTLYGPSATALIACHHQGTRTTALSLHQAAFYAGWFASGVVVAVALNGFGSWRFAYAAMGIIGILLGMAFLLCCRSTAGSAPVRERKPSIVSAVKAFVGLPSAILAAGAYVSLVFVAFAYGAWGPKFVALKFGLTPAAAGTGVMFWHYAASLAAILVAGCVTDCAVRRWPRFRLLLQVTSLTFAAPVLVLFGTSPSLVGVWTSAALFGVFRGLFEANVFTSLFDVVSEKYRASSVGFFDVLAGSIGSLAPIGIGWLSDRYGVRGFEIGFSLLGVVLLFAAVLTAISLLFTYRKDCRKL